MSVSESRSVESVAYTPLWTEDTLTWSKIRTPCPEGQAKQGEHIFFKYASFLMQQAENGMTLEFPGKDIKESS